MHVVARLRHFVVSHVCEVEGCAVTMTTLRNGVDVSATLQVLDVFLRAEHRSDVKTIVGQVIALENIRPLLAYRIEFAFGGRDEVRHGVGEGVHDIVIVRLDFNQLFAHGGCVGTVLGRTRQADSGSYRMLLHLQVVEFQFVTEGATGIRYQMIFLNRFRRFFRSAAFPERDKHKRKKGQGGKHPQRLLIPVIFLF